MHGEPQLGFGCARRSGTRFVPVSTNHSAGDYPLANSSRRRRRLATLTHVLKASPELRRLAATRLRSERLNVWTSSPSGDLSLECPAPHAGLQTLLASLRHVAWMVAGDDQSRPDGDFPGFCQRFAAAIRPQRRPCWDPVINVAWGGCRLADVRAHLGDWLAHAPDVLLLLSGAADAAAGVAGLSRFEADAAWILGQCRDASIVPILTTSPLPLVSEDDADYVAPLVYAESIRALSVEWDVPLIDFRDEWEQLAIRPGLAGSWIDDTATGASSIGLMHLVDQLIREFDRHLDVDRQPDQIVTTASIPR